MKALTLTQPWATLVAIGAKRIETRSWGTSFRGPLAIHAAKGFPRDCRDQCDEEPFYTALENGGYFNTFRNGGGVGDRGGWQNVLPLGAVIATCRLVKCYRVGPLDRALFDEREQAFGNFSPGRWAWELADVDPLLEPIPARGSLGLWEWEMFQ